VAVRQVRRIGMALEDPPDGIGGVGIHGLPQLGEALVDRFADDVRQCHAALAQRSGLAKALGIEADVDEPGRHVCKDSTSLRIRQVAPPHPSRYPTESFRRFSRSHDVDRAREEPMSPDAPQPYGLPITLDTAKRAAAPALAEAAKNHWAMAVAIVDAAG